MVVHDLDAALRLAGFTLAHGAGSVETGETLCTLAFVQTSEGRKLFRFEAATIPESIEQGRQFLPHQMQEGDLAALAFDGYATLDDGSRTDALCVEVTQAVQFDLVTLGHVVQPYRSATRRLGRFGRTSGFEVLGDPSVEGRLDVDTAHDLIREGFLEHPSAARLLPGR